MTSPATEPVLDPERTRPMPTAPSRALLRASFAPGEEHPVEAFGLTFRNPVGLAAGYDKDALGWRGLAAMGFGHVEVGTVTPLPQAGNPKPRVFRLVRETHVALDKAREQAKGAQAIGTTGRGIGSAYEGRPLASRDIACQNVMRGSSGVTSGSKRATTRPSRSLMKSTNFNACNSSSPN